MPCISEPRPTVGKYAPKIIQIQIDPQKIGDVVGQRGKTINTIIERTGVKIDISEDGAVSICGTDQVMMNKAADMIRIIVTDFEAGQVFTERWSASKNSVRLLSSRRGKKEWSTFQRLRKKESTVLKMCSRLAIK